MLIWGMNPGRVTPPSTAEQVAANDYDRRERIEELRGPDRRKVVTVQPAKCRKARSPPLPMRAPEGSASGLIAVCGCTGRFIQHHDRDIVHDGKRQSLTAWARELGMCPQTLARRLDRGWSVVDAFTMPVRAKSA